MFKDKFIKLKEKINNIPIINKFDITLEEKIIIENKEEFQYLLVDTIENNPSIIKIDEVIETVNEIEDLKEIIFNHKNKLVFINMINYFFEIGTLSIDLLEVFCSQAELSDDYLNKMKQKLIKLYKDKNSINKIKISDDIQIDELLDYDRFDIISKCDFDLNVDSNIIKKLLNKWPKELDLPRFSLNYLDQVDLNMLSYETIIYKILYTYKDRLKYIQLLEEKNYDNTIDIKLSAYQQYRLYNILILEKKSNLINDLFENKIISFKEIDTKAIIYFINNFNENQLDNIIDLLIRNRNNDEIIYSLIDNNKFNFIEQLELDYDKYENIINDKISHSKKSYEVYYIPNLLPKSIKNNIINNMKINEIKFNNYNDDYDMFDDDLLNEIETIIMNNPDIIIDVYSYLNVDSKIFDLLLKYNKLDFEKYNFSELINSLSVRKYLKNNYILANYIIDGANFYEENDFIDFIGKDKFLSELAFDKICKNYKKKVPPYNIIKTIILNKINLNNNLTLSDLDKIYSVLGDDLIFNLNTPNIVRILNYPKEKLNKFLDLFSENKYAMSDLEAAYDSLKQYEFANNNPDIINIYSNLINAIDNQNTNKINEIINSIDSILTIENIKNIIGDNFKDVKSALYYFISKSDSKLHLITDKYIMTCRENYRAEYMPKMDEELQLSYILNQKDYNEEFYKSFIKLFYNNFENNNFQWKYYKLKMYQFGLDIDMSKEAMAYYLFGQNPLNYEIKDIYKCLKNIKLFILDCNLHNPFFGLADDYINLAKSQMDYNKIKKDYYIEPNKLNLCQLINLINLDVFEEEILNNDNYNSLLKIMKSKKLHLIPKCINKLANNSNLSINYNNIAYFITNFSKLSKYYKKFNFIDIIQASELYSTYSSTYAKILTTTDENLIILDSGNFKTHTKIKENRLKKAVDLTVNLFLRKEITVPPISKNIQIGDKNLYVTLGNFTDSSNVTHGERTDSCMRIDGVGNDFLNFCSLNKNGFHIIFNDPSNDNYVSRISGFRNGNTVFLNELRFSTVDEYSDNDLIEATKIIAKEIINESKKSSYPIDNVVIAKQYVMENSSMELIDFNIKDCREGYPKFHCDIKNNGVLLASSNNDKLVPIILNQDNLPIYLTARHKYKKYDNVKAIEKINRINAIKNKITGNNEILINLNNIIYNIIGDDWYIYIDNENHIYFDYIDIDSRAFEEMNNCLNKIQNNFNELVNLINQNSLRK